MSDNLDHVATERVLKARAELIMARRFYGVLVSHVEPVLSRKVETMATDGKRHYYNPDFIATLTQQELLAVQAHESEHDARHHGTRRGSRDPMKWNIACDYAINGDLLAEGFKLPAWVLHDPKYRGMSAEDIYRSRELDEQKQQQQAQQNGEDEPENQPGSKAGDGDEEADDQGDDAGADSQDDDSAEQEADGGDDDGDGQDEASDSEDEGNGQVNGNQPADNGGEPSTSGDPGRCGEVLDSAVEDDEAGGELSDEDIKWERITRQAASMAKAVGQLPGHISREIERANNPARNWRDELREFCEQGALSLETWNRPNRRFAARRQILPSSQRYGINKAAIIIDTSGSMDTVALASVRNEMQALVDDGIVENLTVIYGDTRVTRIDEFTTGDNVEFDPKGGGGTDLKPMFAHVAAEVSDASVLIVFTDLMIGDAGPEPLCPVLFAVTGYPDRVKELIAKAPWGARGIDVGAHT